MVHRHPHLAEQRLTTKAEEFTIHRARCSANEDRCRWVRPSVKLFRPQFDQLAHGYQGTSSPTGDGPRGHSRLDRFDTGAAPRTAGPGAKLHYTPLHLAQACPPDGRRRELESLLLRGAWRCGSLMEMLMVGRSGEYAVKARYPSEFPGPGRRPDKTSHDFETTVSQRGWIRALMAFVPKLLSEVMAYLLTGLWTQSLIPIIIRNLTSLLLLCRFP